MNDKLAVVRFRTFGVRLKAIFRPVIACPSEVSTPDRFTGRKMRLKP